MDYLQEGINLRAMGQRDPLTEWQREGYEMFGQMMQGIAQDLVRYVMHVQVQVEAPPSAPAVGTDFNQPAEAAPVNVGGQESAVSNMQYSAPEEGASGMAAAARSVAAEGGGQATATATAVADEPTMQPTVRSDWEKTPRNAPCPCGSGKKFKLCHGRA
jgi:preprotein translocase subunit SecA